MAATPAGTEPARDALQGAADHLETTTVPEFAAAFAALFGRRDSFDPARDALDVAVVPDARVGIEDWSAYHLRVGDDGLRTLYRRPFQRGYQPQQIGAVHPVGHELAPPTLMQGLFEVFVHHLTQPDPMASLSNATLKVAMYRDELAQPAITD